MKIKRIQMKNIGSYVNDMQLDFDISDRKRRMVLIGGKNGAGKTTLFNAVKIGLYGCMAFGFESNGTKYYEEISKIINANEMLKKAGEAEIVIDLLLDDGKFNHVYTFSRSWKVSPKKIVETFDLYKDDIVLSETEKSNFESFLLQTLPPNLFRFYFFDGEKISNFVFNNSKNSDFKDALLKICNLDTLEIIQENFRRIVKSKVKSEDSLSDEYTSCLEADKTLSEKISKAEEDYKRISDEIGEIDSALIALERKYAKNGGVSKTDWQSMHNQLAKEDSKRQETRKWLKDIANNVLPFIIVRQQLCELKNQIELEHQSQAAQSVSNTINTPEIRGIIARVISKAGVELSEDLSNKIVEEICNFTNASEIKTILNLSEADQYEMLSQINSLLMFDIGRIKKATDEINKSLTHTNQIRKKMEQSSTNDYENYLREKSKLNELRSQKTQRMLELNEDLYSLKEQKNSSVSKLAKAKNEYEAVLKQISINDISARALLAFEELQGVLYQKSIQRVEDEFKKSFKALINKSDLIDGIHIDESLNVLPYKKKRFSVRELNNIVEKNSDLFLINQIGHYAYDVFQEKRNGKRDDIMLPAEVNQTLSAGEKQIFIMALYQALSRLNKINVPYIIDTPFARIDKDHRNNILEHFFKKLKGQVIILSTDEEIVGKYYQAIDVVVSDKYLLKHTSDGSTQILQNKYFGGRK